MLVPILATRLDLTSIDTSLPGSFSCTDVLVAAAQKLSDLDNSLAAIRLGRARLGAKNDTRNSVEGESVHE